MARTLQDKVKRLLEFETGTIRKPLDGRIRFALAFPGSYRIGMSSLGFQLVYGLLNAMPSAVCERAFLPDPEDTREMLRSRTRLFTHESQTPLAEFDVIAFSISFEMDYAAVVRMLDLAGIPAFSADRNDSHPLIIAGGPCATFNPEPLADIVDAFAIGDAEEIVADLVRTIEESIGSDRIFLLERLTAIPGIYVPRFYEPEYAGDRTIASMKVTAPASERIERRITRDLDRYDNRAVITTRETEFSNMLLTEAIRGCMRQCRFCSAGYMWLPPRPRKLDDFPEGARVGLVGSAVFDHPDALSICRKLEADGRDYSVSSIRIESLTPDLAGMMFRAGQRTFTVAPEAGSERLRRVINKPTTDLQVIEAAGMAAEAGAARLKLYFMIGLPTETDEDVAGIAELAHHVADSQPSISIQLSVSCYVPKPWTPFQWAPMAGVKELSQKLVQIKKTIGRDKRIQIGGESPRIAHIQGWLARGDRRLGKVIVAAARDDAGYARAASELDIDTEFYANRSRTPEEKLPWDHIDLLVDRSYLWDEFQRAADGKITHPCKVGLCSRCGVC